MKSILKLIPFLFVFLLMNCGGKEEKYKPTYGQKKAILKVDKIPASKKIDLINKGFGPIKSIELDEVINQEMASLGKVVFKKMCTACHRVEKKFIGPSPKGVLKRRTPEWVMNMILNPNEMAQKDPLAKALLIEFNGSPMANQNLSEEDARAILEYFRTLK
jgi:cytochrome c